MIDRVEHEGGILELRLNRPPANALNPVMIRAIGEALAAAAQGGARAVVLSGRPGMFSAGLDVPELLALEREGIVGLWRGLYDLLHRLAAFPLPVAAAITGHSPAGGAVMALFCDTRIMAAGDFRIGLNEAQVGLPMPPVIFRALSWVVGPHRAELLAAGAHLVGPAEALRLGFVDEVVPVEQVVERAVEWCRERLVLPRGAHAATRRMARQSFIDLFRGADEEHEALADEWFSEETRGAMRALVARLAAKKGQSQP
jgi:enoyl-CoA hydratase/carnithine racemase